MSSKSWEKRTLKLNKTVDEYEKVRLDLSCKVKKLEREIYKVSWENRKLCSVIELQKGSLHDFDKDYSKLLSDHIETENLVHRTHIKRNYETVPPYLETTNACDGSSVLYKKYQSRPNLIRDPTNDNILHSFDNILTPLEAKSNYEQISPFSSAKTLNRLGKTANKFEKNALGMNMTDRCNRLIQDISESHQTIKDRSVSSRYLDENISYTENHHRSHSKNMSCSSAKHKQIIDQSSSSIVKWDSKLNISKNQHEMSSHTINSPLTEMESSSKKKQISGQK